MQIPGNPFNSLWENEDALIKAVHKHGSGEIAWQAPSNCALIKYWGKRADQLPQNPSLSFNLANCLTTTKVRFRPKTTKEIGPISCQFSFDGQKMASFEKRISAYLAKCQPYLPFLKMMELSIQSSNNFPHSAGIASSASSFAALALCLSSIEQRLDGESTDTDESFFKKASFLARLGSGSACRSLFSGPVIWGENPYCKASSDEFAQRYRGQTHPIFNQLVFSILVVDSAPKKISSSQGHEMMADHPFAQARYNSAKKNLAKLLEAFARGDFNLFSQIVESEAMQLHALMMTSQRPIRMMGPKTMAVLDEIEGFKKTFRPPLATTLDAGPNVHLIYPEQAKVEVEAFVHSKLVPLLDRGQWIQNFGSSSPKQL